MNSLRTGPKLVRELEDFVTACELLRTEVATERVAVVVLVCICFGSVSVRLLGLCWCLLDGVATVFTPRPLAATVCWWLLETVPLFPVTATLVDTVPPDPAFLYIAFVAMHTPDVVVTVMLTDAAAVVPFAGGASTGSSKLSKVESDGGLWAMRWRAWAEEVDLGRKWARSLLGSWIRMEM